MLFHCSFRMRAMNPLPPLLGTEYEIRYSACRSVKLHAEMTVIKPTLRWSY
jgi:hypothetical protein